MCWRGLEVARVGPAADGQEDLEVAVAALEEVELLHAAVEVCPDVVPAVALPVDVGVGPAVGEVDLARVGAHVGEGVEDVGEVLDGEVLGAVLAGVDCPDSPMVLVTFGLREVRKRSADDVPVDKVGYRAEALHWTAAHCVFGV